MKHLFTLIAVLCFSLQLQAQDLNIPNNPTLETEADYKRTEPYVLKTIEWIQNTPLNEQKELRTKANAFLLIWLTGSPTVTVEIGPNMVTESCEECLMIFLSGWTKYSLSNNYSKDKAEGALAGAEAVIAFYKKNKSALGRQPEIEKWIKKQKKGQLKKYISSTK